MTDEHFYPFQAEWEARQNEPLPEFTKPKQRLGIGINEIPPLTPDTDKLHVRHAIAELLEFIGQPNENAPTTPPVSHQGNDKLLFQDEDNLT